MSDSKFDVVFYGELFDGYDKADVKANFARIFRVSDEKINRFFSSPRVVLKGNVDRKTADKYKAILAKTGAVVTVEAREPAGGVPAAPAQKATAKPPPGAPPTLEKTADAAVPGPSSAEAQNVGPIWGRKVEAGKIGAASPEDSAETGRSDEHGSLERGIAGDYPFSIGETLSEAWQKVNGNKGTAVLAMMIYIGIMIAYGVVAGLIKFVFTAVAGETGTELGAILTDLGQFVITAPLGAGFFMLGVRMSIGAPTRAGSILNYYDRIVPLALTTLLSGLMIILGIILLVIPGIYLSVAYFLALPLVVDKGLGPWQAMEASRKAVTHRWFSVFGLLIVLGLLSIAGAIPLFIGFIWTIPLYMIALGILYRNIFGVSSIQAE